MKRMVFDLLIPISIGFVTGVFSTAVGHGITHPMRWVVLGVCITAYLIIKHMFVKSEDRPPRDKVEKKIKELEAKLAREKRKLPLQYSGLQDGELSLDDKESGKLSIKE